MPGNKRRSRCSRGLASDSWERVAGWYDGWVGSRGSRYHQALAIPAVLDLLNPGPGEEILDVGAGQGVLGPHIAARGARYTGIDASPRLINLARRRHGAAGRYFVGDARRMQSAAGLHPHSYDAAVFLLSIQDMDPLESIFASLDWALRPSSRVVVLMTHPSFRQPRHAGWGFDEGRKLVYRRVDAYLSPMAVPMKALGDGVPTRSYHRPLSSYVNGLAAVGFAVDALVELPDLPGYARPGRRRAETRADAEIPLFLALRARRG
ncbi:MAG: methyltransferase domain-containing protein [Chloroflexota bacterium]|nr:methyltransferase domain-containing protein [Chloroflexota bacterium]